MQHLPPPPHARRPAWSDAVFALLVGCAFVAFACTEEPADAPQTLRVLEQPVSMTSLPYLCGPYPEELLRGLSQQLIDEVNCIQPGVLAPFDVSKNVGSIYIQPMRAACSGQVPNPIPQYLRPEARDAAQGVAAQNNDFMTIRSGYRDVGMQYYDYYHSLTYGYAAAMPGQSNHQAGRAIDVEANTFWRQKLLDYGWEWPFGTSDAPHFEWPSANVPDLQVESVRAFQRLWNRNNPGDRIAEDGVWGGQSEVRIAQSPAQGFAYGGCDDDTDGYASTEIQGDDCDDTNPAIHPGAPETCGDGVDQDCVGGDLPCGSDIGTDTSVADTASPTDTVSPTDTTITGDTGSSGQDTWTSSDTATDTSAPDAATGADGARYGAWQTGRDPNATVEAACGCQLRSAQRAAGGTSAVLLVLFAMLGIRRRPRRNH